MRAAAKNEVVASRIQQVTGVWIGLDDAATLRRAEMTLHRWAEGECGDSNDYRSWCISRDDQGRAVREISYHNENRHRVYRIPDLEAGALKRIAAVCQRHGLHHYHQGDPRGCALYVAAEPLTDTNYSSRGVAVDA